MKPGETKENARKKSGANGTEFQKKPPGPCKRQLSDRVHHDQRPARYLRPCDHVLMPPGLEHIKQLQGLYRSLPEACLTNIAQIVSPLSCIFHSLLHPPHSLLIPTLPNPHHAHYLEGFRRAPGCFLCGHCFSIAPPGLWPSNLHIPLGARRDCRREYRRQPCRWVQLWCVVIKLLIDRKIRVV